MITKTSPIYGALWMLVAVLSFCAMAVASRELMRRMGIFEILFFRTAISLFIVLAVAIRVGAGTLWTAHIGTHMWRNLFHLGGQAAWVYSLSILPLALVFAIEFTIPVWTALLAVLLLGERMNGPRTILLLLGIVGVLIILRPGTGLLQPAAFVMLLGAFFFAVQMIGTKRLSRTDSPMAVIFWMSVLQSPICLAAALPYWVAPERQDVPWILLIGCTTFIAHYCITRAMKLADASVVVPVDFIRLPLISVIGFLFYGESLDPFVILGAAVVFAGTYYALWSEAGRVST